MLTVKKNVEWFGCAMLKNVYKENVKECLQKENVKMDEVAKRLDELAGFHDEAEKLRRDLDEKIEVVMTEEVRQAIADLRTEYLPKQSIVDQRITETVALIKEMTVQRGVTVNGSRMMAVYLPGRETWDGKKLEGLAMVIPAVLEAKKVGDPSVTIRAVKGGKNE